MRWLTRFVKVMPKDYKRMLEAIRRIEADGLSGEEAIMAAFDENMQRRHAGRRKLGQSVLLGE